MKDYGRTFYGPISFRHGSEFWVNPSSYGTERDGGTTFQACLDDIGTDEATIFIQGEWNISADIITIPSNITLVFDRSGLFNISYSFFYIEGEIIADRHQIFNFTGGANYFELRGMTESCCPEWFGAVGDGSTDCTAAINYAIASGCKKISFGKGTYNITSVTDTVGVIFEGCGPQTVIKQTSGTNPAIYFNPSSTPTDYVGIRNLKLSGFNTDETGGTTSGYAINSQNLPNGILIENVVIEYFSYGIHGTDVSEGRIFNVDVRDCWGQGLGGTRLKNWTIDGFTVRESSQAIGLNTCTHFTFSGIHLNNESNRTTGNIFYLVSCQEINIFGGKVHYEAAWLPFINATGCTGIRCFGVDFYVRDDANDVDNMIMLENNTSGCVFIGNRFYWIAAAGQYAGNIINMPSGSNYNVFYGNLFGPNTSNWNFSAFVDNGSNNFIEFLGSVRSTYNLIGSASDSDVLGSKVFGDSYNRFVLDANGVLRWSGGTGAPDTNLYRYGVNVLKTDGKMIATNGWGSGTHSDGDVTQTTKNYRIRVFDEYGNALGYLQVYSG